ncbi:hypothetical protein Taro_003550, partial [Colocasia esculenta]|nr:hypothetical protein [Colocasia esculenta]
LTRRLSSPVWSRRVGERSAYAHRRSKRRATSPLSTSRCSVAPHLSILISLCLLSSICPSSRYRKLCVHHQKMQRIPATIEEQLFLKSIKEECPWENLPKRLQATLSSKEEWHKRKKDMDWPIQIESGLGQGDSWADLIPPFMLVDALAHERSKVKEEVSNLHVNASTDDVVLCCVIHSTTVAQMGNCLKHHRGLLFCLCRIRKVVPAAVCWSIWKKWNDHTFCGSKMILDYCIRKRLQWNTCFARKVCKEGEYYEEMMRYLRKNLAVRTETNALLIFALLFPYHLSEYVCRVMRISPFRYYCDIIFEVMRNEQPYDSIPNFSAADALRLTGIGRNEFIDIMNKCRSKKIMWKLNKSIAKELLPTHPVDFFIEPWWGVCLVNFTLEEFKKLTEEEMATIDKICKEEANSFVLFDPDIVRGLYQRGLVYFDVPVYPDDRFKGIFTYFFYHLHHFSSFSCGKAENVKYLCLYGHR